MWKATRKLKRPTAHTPPLRKPDGNWARDNKQKADAFANHLENTFKPNSMHTTNKINLLQENQEHEVINFVTPKEVAQKNNNQY